MSEQFFSEDGCDQWLAQSGLLPKNGFYVDAGCAHPWRYSQTAFLRNRGWQGLAIDGNPAYATEWEGVENAKFVHALLSDKPTERFLIEPTNALVSRVHESGVITPAYSLWDLILGLGFKSVDFLSADIEGKEAELLAVFMSTPGAVMFPQLKPRIVVAEFNSCHRGRDPRVFNTMAAAKYSLAHLTDSNAIFVR